MSDAVETPENIEPEATEAHAAEVTDPEQDQPDQQVTPEATDWKAESRKWEDRSKTNFTELEQARAALAESQAAARQAEEAAARYQSELTQQTALRTKESILLDAGLPRDLAVNLIGDDEETWKAQAANFAALRSGAPTERRPDPAQSAGAPHLTRDADPNAWLRAAATSR